MLRKASNTLYVNGKFDFDQMHNYRMAVTEREVINGCLSIKKAKLQIPSTITNKVLICYKELVFCATEDTIHMMQIGDLSLMTISSKQKMRDKPAEKFMAKTALLIYWQLTTSISSGRFLPQSITYSLVPFCETQPCCFSA